MIKRLLFSCRSLLISWSLHVDIIPKYGRYRIYIFDGMVILNKVFTLIRFTFRSKWSNYVDLVFFSFFVIYLITLDSLHRLFLYLWALTTVLKIWFMSCISFIIKFCIENFIKRKLITQFPSSCFAFPSLFLFVFDCHQD